MSKERPAPTNDSTQLEATLERASSDAARAASAVAEIRDQLAPLMSSRTQRQWNVEEFERYLTLCHADRAAERSYQRARTLFDHARLQLRRDA